MSCKDTAFSYEGRAVACDLNFDVREGDYLCIVGPNGSGKTTLLRGLLGLKAPSSGTVAYGKQIERDKIGYLPQQSAVARDFPANAWEVALSGRLARRGLMPFYTPADKRIVQEKLTLVHAENLRKQCFRELSGGQQQRVLLARALCAAGQLLLMDEPTAGLDPQVTQELYEVIARLNANEGVAIVMISHDVESALRYASKILHLETRQLFFGTVDAYRASGTGEGFVGCTHV
jgi:zinc transport system ATP-binding protein